jgi:single-stranded-DNA-specific exonuclease
VKPDGVSAGTVGFRLAPRLNAAGRLEDASLALELLDCTTRDDALPLALRLNELNRERQAIESAIMTEACAMVPDPAPPALVLSSSTWHEGVIGIVASRLADRFSRPTILLSEGDDEAKGSGRSVGAFDLLGAVERSAGHLLAYGGHHAACGLRLRREHIAAFRETFVATVAASIGDDLTRVRQVDALVGGHELTLALADELELLAPHGFGNRDVTLLLRGAELVTPRLTRNGRHMQYRVRCQGASCQAIHFNFSELEQVAEPGRHDLVLALSKNEYNGSVSAQVEVKSLRRVALPSDDLCSTECGCRCEQRLRGQELWAALVHEPAYSGGGEAGSSSVASASREDRLIDRRRQPAGPLIRSLVAGGERVLVLVADVGRRRPLLTEDVLGELSRQDGLYLHSACPTRFDLIAGARVVMAGVDMVAGVDSARLAGALAGFEHIVFVDPPFTRALFEEFVRSAPNSWLHLAWGRPEVDFAGNIRQAEYDLDAAARRVWRALSAGSGRFDEALEQELLSSERFLHPAGAVAAALRVLREAGLVQVEGDVYRLERPAGKADITQTESHGAWHRLFLTNDFLSTCLTARL